MASEPRPGSFFGQVEQRAKNTLLCIGLDPREKTAEAAKNKCIGIIDATIPYAACYKPNAAFFEVFGAQGWLALEAVIAHCNTNGVPVILDAKRGDIADTAAAYATSAFTHLKAGAITVSPYMGIDSLKPFTQNPMNGVFALCKTSNKGANELQALQIAGGEGEKKTLFETVAAVAEKSWNINGNVGLVCGATDPEAMKKVRAAAPNLWFLVPGVGTQGGSLEASISAGLRARDCSGMLINVSRGIAGAADPGAAAKKLCAEIQEARANLKATRSGCGTSCTTTVGKKDQLEALSGALLASKCVRLGSFKLKSGLISPIYLDLRRLVTYPKIMQLVAKEYATLINKIKEDVGPFDRLVGLPYAALPIATAVSLEMNVPMIYPRREAKQYGTKASIEGEFNKGDRVVIIDDLVTTGETKIEAIDKLLAAGLKVVSIVVLIDREMGATEFLGKHGYHFKAVASLTQLLGSWKRTSAISDAQLKEVLTFMGKGSKM